MKLIKPSYKIITKIHYQDILEEIEQVARTCYKSEDKIEKGSAEKLIKRLLDSKHEAMIEFGPSITVKFVCDRGVSHELVRHRLASFAQESTRYCDYSRDKFDRHVSFIIPNWIEDLDKDVTIPTKDSVIEFVENTIHLIDSSNLPALTWLNTMADIERNYFSLLSNGWQPQQARSILPNSLKTEINVKSNLRHWRLMFKLRTPMSAHPQMRELMVPLLKEFKEKMPLLFGDL